MSYQFPGYPRGSDGDIPEELCFDVIRVWAEWGGAYLWDMNGVCATVGLITKTAHEDLDDDFERWQARYESKPLNEADAPKWDSEEERAQFDRDGIALAEKLYNHLRQAHTVIYCATDQTQTRFVAVGKPRGFDHRAHAIP